MSNVNHGDGGQEQQGSEDLANALSGGETEFVSNEEKKPVVTQGMLYLLLLVAIGGGGTYYMYQRQGPAAAAAAATPEAAKAQETINTFLTNGPEGIKKMEDMLKNTEKVVQQFLDYPSVTQVPLSDLHTNPFRFTKAEATENATAEAEKKKRDADRAAAMKASQGLNLQSIIHSGSRKACMINNTLYLEGQQVDDFTIEKITPKTVIVKTGVYRFELSIQK